ncbi:hypothetical protein EVAR_41420_1 [Eumeta japonica]|uniref:Uncharacterized protein n=1 Tax=Eumeta variegata TaxID=151549 RepID=A0A4C1W7I8_EUMVA|nr:hypothetical protein EVAR_41420_1 [Eumeta japonica]
MGGGAHRCSVLITTAVAIPCVELRVHRINGSRIMRRNWYISLQCPAIICHHIDIPPSLISIFHFTDVLVKSFALLFTIVATMFRKVLKVRIVQHKPELDMKW